MLYPLKFKSIYKEKIWGGNKLSTVLNKDIDTNIKTGESWELSAIQDNISVISNGFLQENNIEEKNILYIMFTQTSDLKSRNPAAALRASGYGTEVPLFCSQELEITGMMEKVIRIMIVFKTSHSIVKPIYLRRAANLRPDFTN